MKDKLKEQKLVFICILFALLLGYPFLKMMNKPRLTGAIPSLYLYVFGVWLLCIISVWLTVDVRIRRNNKKNNE